MSPSSPSTTPMTFENRQPRSRPRGTLGESPGCVKVATLLAARVAELADALDLGSRGATRGGSTPPSRTIPSRPSRRQVVALREYPPVDAPHVCDRRHNVPRRCGRALAEGAGKGLDPDFPHPIAVQHRLDRQLRADEGAPGLQFDIREDRAAHHPKSGGHVPERGPEQEAQQLVVEPGDEQPGARVDLLVPERDDQVVPVPYLEQLDE